MSRLETHPIYVKHITTNKPIYHYMYSIDMQQAQLNQMTKKQIISLLSKMKCRLVGGRIVPADQFDFKNWKKSVMIEHYLGCVQQKENGEV